MVAFEPIQVTELEKGEPYRMRIQKLIGIESGLVVNGLFTNNGRLGASGLQKSNLPVIVSMMTSALHAFFGA